MNLSIHIETHIYSEEQLRDERFSDPNNFGILSPEDFAMLYKFHDYWMNMEYDQTTTLGDVAKTVANKMTHDIENYHPFPGGYLGLYMYRFRFISKGIRYSICNPDANLASTLSKYLDPDGTGVISVSILASSDAGEVWSENNLRYVMRSHEGNKHNEPHVHVMDKQTRQEASISLLDFSVVAGSLPSKAEKKAKQTIKERQAFFIECWNTKTDGLNVDINKYLGLINY